MKIKEFAENLEKFFGEFFGGNVVTTTNYASGEFCIIGELTGVRSWQVIPQDSFVGLYDIRVSFDSEEPIVYRVDLYFIGETLPLHCSLEDALIEIKENLATTRSAAINDNL